MDPRIAGIVATLPGKDCGQCGFRTCAGLAGSILHEPSARSRCVHLHPADGSVPVVAAQAQTDWQDILGREYQMLLEPFPGDPGPRETILPFNPALSGRLALRAGSIVFGRPAGVGCPVTHVGRLMAQPDPLSGALAWCVVGPIVGREAGAIEIGDYHIVAYEGLVRATLVTPQVGARCFFKPALCMLQSRHSGVLSFVARRADGWHVRLEGIAIA